ncbi:hypothetical protein [Actinomycetospora flava]|uniref:Uncharacterized protein n=1 Tax=Actinomycetospora flava TaxID=3129232 RepID=A0ABU8LZN4_9PSEU
MTAVRDSAPSGRHARRETGAPSGPLVPLRTVVRTPAPSAAVELAPGRLVIDSSYSRLCPHLGARRVAVSVDGYPWRFAWGRTPIDLPAGRHLVEIEVEHGRTGRRSWGHVADAVPVCAGNTVEVFYRAPALPRLAGSLGPARQRTAGFAVCAALLALGGVAVLAALGLLVLAVVPLVA